jgi:hypothetical protein
MSVYMPVMKIGVQLKGLPYLLLVKVHRLPV